jgi:hypothetical protein
LTYYGNESIAFDKNISSMLHEQLKQKRQLAAFPTFTEVKNAASCRVTYSNFFTWNQEPL